jgi:mannose-6-phosphate isomerase-like protein (cupin superfamily)
MLIEFDKALPPLLVSARHNCCSNKEAHMSRNAMTAIERVAIQPAEGESFDFGALGVVWKIESPETEGRFSVVEHPIPPRSLAAPLHFHHNEDEYSYVLEGRLGALLGDRAVEAGPGSWVFKPRGEWHAFWNAGDTPARIIEVISPAGFENYFREVADVFRDAGDGPPDLARFAAVNERYDLEMDFDSVPVLAERFGLTHPLLG